MNNISLEAIESANRLIMFAMAPRSTPATKSEYGELFTRYGKDPEFREVVCAAARGMEIEILPQTLSTGLMLLPVEGGLFSPTLDNFRRGMQFRDRIAYGLLHYVLVAYAFPTAEALADDLEVLTARIVPSEVARFAVEFCEGLRATGSEQEALSEEMIEASAHLLSLRERDDGGKKNVTAMVRYILDKYEDEGLFTVQEHDDGKEIAYRGRAQFRVQARYLMREAEGELLQRLQALRESQKEQAKEHG
ncbi:MAG: hypothetical protein QOC70_399 [Verrucomicrobiota bacterium]